MRGKPSFSLHQQPVSQTYVHLEGLLKALLLVSYNQQTTPSPLYWAQTPAGHTAGLNIWDLLAQMATLIMHLGRRKKIQNKGSYVGESFHIWHRVEKSHS